jgi:alkylation response protein AidB-like acyl-CoA dehydrogenase
MSYVKNMPHAYARDEPTELAMPAGSTAARWSDAIKGLPMRRLALAAFAVGALASAAYAARDYLNPAKPTRRKPSAGRGGAKRRPASAV